MHVRAQRTQTHALTWWLRDFLRYLAVVGTLRLPFPLVQMHRQILLQFSLILRTAMHSGRHRLVGEIVDLVTSYLPSVDLNTDVVLVKDQLERVFLAQIAFSSILVFELYIIFSVVSFATTSVATAIVARGIDRAPALPIVVLATVYVHPTTGAVLVSAFPPHTVDVANTIFADVTRLWEKLRSQCGCSIKRRLTPSEIGTRLLGFVAFAVSSSTACLKPGRYHCAI